MTEQDEIRRLKELIAKQQLQLAEKDEIIRNQNIRIENMTQALLHAKKKIFGRSSEMTAPTVQRTIKEVPPRQPKRKHKGNARSQ